MKKFIALAIAILMVLSFAACSNNAGKPDDTSSPNNNNTENHEKEPSDTDKPNENNKAVSPAEVEAAIAKVLGDGYFCTVDVAEGELFLSNMAGIDLSQIESYVAKISPIPAVDLDTVIIIECKSGYADTAVEVLNENYAHNISYIRLYPFNVAKVEGARLYKIGNVVMFIMAGNYAPSDATAEDEAKLAASEYEKIDNAIKNLFGSVPENLAIIKEPEIPDNGGEFDGGFEDFEDMPMIGG